MAGHAQLKFVMTECSEDTNSLDGVQIVLETKLDVTYFYQQNDVT